jgi:hypothetical protein
MSGVILQDPARTGWDANQRGDGEKAAPAFRAYVGVRVMARTSR